jgi:hypothetical protein
MARKGKAGAARKSEEIKVNVSVHYNGDPLYANYAEVNSSQHEFQIGFALAPTRPSPEQIEQARAGTVTLDGLVQILLAPTLIPALIRALNISKDQHEATFGPIKEVGA